MRGASDAIEVHAVTWSSSSVAHVSVCVLLFEEFHVVKRSIPSASMIVVASAVAEPTVRPGSRADSAYPGRW